MDASAPSAPPTYQASDFFLVEKTDAESAQRREVAHVRAVIDELVRLEETQTPDPERADALRHLLENVDMSLRVGELEIRVRRRRPRNAAAAFARQTLAAVAAHPAVAATTAAFVWLRSKRSN